MYLIYNKKFFLLILEKELAMFFSVTSSRRPRSVGRLANFLRQTERDFIFKALKQHHGHNSKTAEWLGVSRRALYDKMSDYGLDTEASAMRAEAGIMGPRRKLGANPKKK